MSRICDTCKKPIPLGTNDVIKVDFQGRFGKLVKSINKVKHLDFCSLECFDKFKIPVDNK